MPRYQKSVGFAKANVGQLITVSSKCTVESLTADATLDAEDSGKIFLFDNAAGGVDVTLPTPGAAGAGWNAKFIQHVTPATANNTIVNPTANAMFGVLAAATTAGSGEIIVAGEDTINFIFGSGVIGDMVEIVSTGTSYIVNGWQSLAAGITTS